MAGQFSWHLVLFLEIIRRARTSVIVARLRLCLQSTDHIELWPRGGGGGVPNKGRYGCAAWALGISGVNICRALGFGRYILLGH